MLGAAGVVAIVLVAGPRLAWWLTALLCWLWLASPLPLIPWVPSTIRMRIGKPISSAELFGEGEGDLDGAYRKVEGAVQALVDER